MIFSGAVPRVFAEPGTSLAAKTECVVSKSNAAPSNRLADRWVVRRRVRVVLGVVAASLAIGWPLRLATATLLKERARSALAAREPDRAVLWLNRAEGWFGADGETSFLRARADRQKGDWNALLMHLKQASALGCAPIRIEREQWLAQAQSGQLRDVETRLPRLLADPREDGAEICEAYVNGYFLNHRLTEAGRLLDAWIADFPHDPEPLYIRGKIRSESQFYKDAEDDFRGALSRAPKYWPALFELANTLAIERDFEHALAVYRRARNVAGHDARARIGEIKCLRQLGRLDDARAAVQPLLDVDSPSREALQESGLIDIEDERYATAAETLTKALAINPRSLVVRQALARALRQTGDQSGAREHARYVEEAQAALRRAEELSDRVARSPDDAGLRYEIGTIYLQYGVPERGVNWLKSALNCDPGHQASRQALDKFFAESPPSGGGQTTNP